MRIQANSFIKRNSATILTILGGVGVVVTSVTAVKATPKAIKLLDEARKEKNDELTRLEKIKIAGPSYVPATIIGAASIACIFGANIKSKKYQAAILSAYTLVDSSYREYKDKLKELFGEDAHQEIVDAIAAEKAKNVGVYSTGFVSSNKLFVDEQCGEERLFYDEYANRFFTTTLEQVMSAEYHLNRNYVLRGYTVLNEFYDFLGLEPTESGSELGWAINDDGSFWIDFNHRETEINGQKCIIIEMPFGPDLEWKEYY